MFRRKSTTCCARTISIIPLSDSPPAGRHPDRQIMEDTPMTITITGFELAPPLPCFCHHPDMHSLQITPTIGSEMEDRR